MLGTGRPQRTWLARGRCLWVAFPAWNLSHSQLPGALRKMSRPQSCKPWLFWVPCRLEWRFCRYGQSIRRERYWVPFVCVVGSPCFAFLWHLRIVLTSSRNTCVGAHRCSQGGPWRHRLRRLWRLFVFQWKGFLLSPKTIWSSFHVERISQWKPVGHCG